MSLDVLSPVGPEPPSPMLTSVTPVTPDTSTCPASVSSAQLMDPERPEDGALVSGSEPGRTEPGRDASRRMKKPPPLHTGADWKVVLHLPEIEKWLKATSDRVTQLSHSVGQDGDNRHVDVHLVQLKDICEDISDHVEQIHALLETEFSLKLLSYSVNIIVDIRTVQLLWHQLRVSVLVLKERLLQGLQDSNGNFTRQTDILQAFSQDQHQTRLDALTEVDDCGQLTIRCSQDYFSLDCGITAFELSDYSPSDEHDAPGTQTKTQDSPETQTSTQDAPLDVNQDPGVEGSGSHLSNLHHSLPDLSTDAGSANQNRCVLPTMQCGSLSDGVKRPLQAAGLGTEPSLPKRAALQPNSRGGSGEVSPVSGLQFQAELSRSTPSLMDPPDRSKFWLELDSVYPEHVSQSYESLQVMNGRNLRRHRVSSRHPEGIVQRLQPSRRSSSGAGPTAGAPPPLQDPEPEEGKAKQMESRRKETRSPSEDSDSSASPVREQPPSDLEASGEDSDPRPPPKTEVWILKRHKGAPISRTSPDRQHWFGSEEFLALPAQLRKTEMLAMKLESLTQSVPPRPGDSALQDVDDWDLTELNWDSVDSVDVESSDDIPSPPPALPPYRRNLLNRSSPSSSSDVAPSLDGSIESGRLSELQSEEDGRPTAPPVDGRGCSGLVQRLLEDIQSQDKEPDVWMKIERLVQQLDGFISWLQEALDSTENWTQPRQDLDSLRVYLDTHLSFKLNVDSHSCLKENIMEDGKELLAVITSNQSGLKEILQMVSSQWDQLQRQIRRQHGWMLRALRCIQARLFYSSQSHEPFTVLGDPSANQKPPCSADGLKVELISSQCEAQRVALEQMAIRLSSLQYPSPTSRRQCSQVAWNNSLQEFEAEYQELWDWLMDMDAMVTDSHQLMMSEEQRHHLFKSSYTELMMMEGRKSSLLGRAESLKRSSTHLPSNFHCKMHNLTHTWNQLQEILSECSGPGSSQQSRRSDRNVLPSGGRGSSVENPRSALSPVTNSLLEQLETRIKELKAWLRDTELLIFNSCLQDKDQSEQLLSFKSLCSEIRARRRGISSVLKLCQKLLQQSQAGPMAEVGPEAEQHREELQLLSINLERRWEAIVMQALQWQNRLRKQQQVPGSFLEPGLVDLRQISPVSAPVAPAPEDSWEWDDTDMTITESEAPEEPDLMQNLPSEPDQPTNGNQPANGNQPTEDPANQHPETDSRSSSSSRTVPQNNNVYQVFSLHQVELYRQPHFPQTSLNKTKSKRKLLLKSLSKDSSFSSIESLPDLLGGRGGDRTEESEGGGGSSRSTDRRSECESGIVSDTGDTETTTTTEDEHLLNHHRRAEGQKEELRRESKRTREEEKRRRTRRGGEAVEILINGRGILTPADSDSDLDGGRVKVESCGAVDGSGQGPGLETPPARSRRASSPLSQGSSLESLLALGVELFPSKDPLQRSASLESCLLPSRSTEAETGGMEEQRGRQAGGEPEEEKNHGAAPGETSSGELSRRTLDLLKRLENIQSPLEAKMTRSVSDMTLRSTSPHRSRLPASPSLGGRHGLLSGASSRRGPPSLINESSATASLTELSSTEDSSLGSEDFRNRRRLLLDPAAPNANSCRKRCHGNRGGAEEADAASLSMVVNVSACTDEDEDDSDLLSSSTLTLTEEELGVRDEEDEEEERLSGASSANEDEDDEDEEEMEGSYVLGFEYMKRELQSWIRPPRSSCSSSRTEAGLRDELQCGTNLTSSPSSSSSSSSSQSNEQRCFLSTKLKDTRRQQRETEEENRRNATRSYISQFVDDVENGNVEQSCLKGGDEDELLREESSVFTKKGEALREAFVYGDVHLAVKPETDCELRPFGSSLVGQLRGELPCHSSAQPSPPSLSPVDDCRSSRTLAGRKAINIQEKFKFSSLVTEETKRQLRDKDSPAKPRRCLHPQTSCCSSSRPHGSKEDIHGFVMEIIDMTSVALKSKENQSQEPNQNQNQEPSPASLAQIRDKVLDHAHRPLHLRKGDFYSYLSLSSHDSDCGELLQCSEEKSSTPAPYSLPSSVHSSSPDLTRDSGTDVLDLDRTSPVPSLPPSPDIRDEETLFPACTEEVYLGPPLCYSMVLTKKGRRLRRDGPDPDPDPGYHLPETGEALSYLTVHLDCSQEDFQASEEPRGPGSDPPAAVCVGRQQSGTPAPYLNPWARVGPIESPAARSADTPPLQSNNAAVMTQIRVRSAATNPPKEPPASVNPQMKRRPMGGDREEGRRGRKGRSLPLQDAGQVNSAVNQTSRSSQGRSQASVRPPTSRTVGRPSMVASGASKIQV